MRYVLLFILIQLLQIPLFILGIPICLVLSIASAWHPQTCDRPWSAVYGKQILVYPKLFWLWSNDEDGVLPEWYCKANWHRGDQLNAFVWTALRNSVHNYCLIPGVFGTGRPLWIKNWTWRGQKYYAKAGWVSAGWPVLSAGKGAW
jgi:hypothetical protein